MFFLTPKLVFYHQMQSKRNLKSESRSAMGITCLGAQKITFEYLKHEYDSNRQIAGGSCRLSAHHEHGGGKNEEA